MNVITVLGSPRRHGNTAAALTAFETLAGQTHHVERINLPDFRVEGCLGCYACQRHPDQPGCAQRDDGNALLQRLLDADLIVYASPVYGWSYPAQAKALIDRHFCLVKWQPDGSCHS